MMKVEAVYKMGNLKQLMLLYEALQFPRSTKYYISHVKS